MTDPDSAAQTRARHGEALAARRALRRHPVWQLLEAVTMAGRLPSEPDLDALRLPPSARRRVSEACQHAVATRATGENVVARNASREAAESIVGDLPPELRDPDYLRPPDSTPDDPAGLAARVSRW